MGTVCTCQTRVLAHVVAAYDLLKIFIPLAAGILAPLLPSRANVVEVLLQLGNTACHSITADAFEQVIDMLDMRIT